MDVGCYAVRAVRDLAALCGGEPRVVAARGGEHPAHPGVDAWLSAELASCPRASAAHVESSMTHEDVDFSLRLVGSLGEAYAPEFVKPHLDDRVVVTLATGRRVEHLGTRPTYTYQLEALTALVREGTPMRTSAADSVVTMELIDDLYRAAGMAAEGRAGMTVRVGVVGVGNIGTSHALNLARVVSGLGGQRPLRRRRGPGGRARGGPRRPQRAHGARAVRAPTTSTPS